MTFGPKKQGDWSFLEAFTFARSGASVGVIEGKALPIIEIAPKEGFYDYKNKYKTVRKYFGEAVVVTQEVDDIISSPIVKETIINNSDCKILLDQRKYMNRFDQIQELLGLTDKEKAQILSINMANNPSRLYKEVWIGLGGTQSAVYATEVSMEEYLCYTTEETEKMQVLNKAAQLGGSVEAAIRLLANERREGAT